MRNKNTAEGSSLSAAEYNDPCPNSGGPAAGLVAQGHEAELSPASLRAEFASFVGDASFPCLGAKAAFNRDSYCLSIYDDLRLARCSNSLAEALQSFVEDEMACSSDYATFIAAFRQPQFVSEREFERLLWFQLDQLHRIDSTRSSWDASVSSDPKDKHFSFSFGGRALYVVGLHPNSSRLARRFRWPALVFNLHEQFEKLREDGKWSRMQESIRARDRSLQGNVNPMLSDFGENSEARQYSGRQVEDGWEAPFEAERSGAHKATSRCPFSH